MKKTQFPLTWHSNVDFQFADVITLRLKAPLPDTGKTITVRAAIQVSALTLSRYHRG